MIIKRIEELETTQDGVKRFIEDYITGSFIDINPLGERRNNRYKNCTRKNG